MDLNKEKKKKQRPKEEENPIVVGNKYRFIAPWHPKHLTIVEVIQERPGISQAYEGRTIYHIATDPSSSTRYEDFDSEFLAQHFQEIEIGLEEWPLEDYLDEKGVENAAKLAEHGIDVILLKDSAGDHYLKIVSEDKVDIIKVEDYDDSVEVDEEDTYSEYSSSDKVDEPEEESDGPGGFGPPNPNLR